MNPAELLVFLAGLAEDASDFIVTLHLRPGLTSAV